MNRKHEHLNLMICYFGQRIQSLILQVITPGVEIVYNKVELKRKHHTDLGHYVKGFPIYGFNTNKPF